MITVDGQPVSCSTCAFWHPLPRTPAKGTCRARAPFLVNRPDGAVWTSWPVTLADAWCGDHSTLCGNVSDGLTTSGPC
jgi:hypothetical protein